MVADTLQERRILSVRRQAKDRRQGDRNAYGAPYPANRRKAGGRRSEDIENNGQYCNGA